jgi:uncharacterized membrane protein
MLRQGPLDLWAWLCIAATLLLVVHALITTPWRSPGGAPRLALIITGVIGTALVLLLPSLHGPLTGLLWTLILISLLCVTFYLDLLPRLGTPRTSTLIALRIAAVLVLIPMLFEPVLSFVVKPIPVRPLVFVIDTSGSMSFPDVPNGPSRLQSVWQAIQSELPRINQHFVPSYITFDTTAGNLDHPDQLATMAADGKSTDLLAGITAANAKSSRADAAVVLFSDGQDNTTPDPAAALANAPHPVSTVVVGSDQAEPANIPNVAVDSVDTPDDLIVGHQSALTAHISSTALNDRLVDVQMADLDAAGKPTGAITKQSLVLRATPAGQTVQFTYTPQTTGVHRIAVWIDPIPGERSVVDNRQEFQGLALDPRIRVLYVEGRVRPEYQQLFRAFGRDPNIEIATFLRIQQDRFAASGTVDGVNFTALPTDAAAWKKFDVVIIGDLDSSFLTRDQQSAIVARVSDGGGLLMIGGQTTLGPGGYKDSLLEAALPVLVGDKSSPQETTPFVPELTAEGLAHPALEGLSDWFTSADKKPKNDLPTLRGNVVVGAAKPGAQILLVHPGKAAADGSPQIVLATQRYGLGRSAVFTADTTYLWYLPLRGLGQDSPYNRFWGQLVRWLAGEDVRNRQQGAGVIGLLDKSVFKFGQRVSLRALVRDEHGDATNFAQVNMTLSTVTPNASSPSPSTPSGQSTQIAAQPLQSSQARTGMYDTALVNLNTGQYSIQLVATKDGKELGRQTLNFTVIPPADEMSKLAANPDLMSRIAQQTGGYTCRIADFSSLIDQLIRADPQSAAPQQRSIPLADFPRSVLALLGHEPKWPSVVDLPIQAGLFILLIAVEWALRRRWQLP